jgi:hypothetical protein
MKSIQLENITLDKKYDIQKMLTLARKLEAKIINPTN